MCKCAKCICFFNKMTNKRIPAAGFEVCGGEFPYVLIPLSQPIGILVFYLGLIEPVLHKFIVVFFCQACVHKVMPSFSTLV